MGKLLKAALLSLKLSFVFILVLWLALAMGLDLAPWSFYGLAGYLAMFFFIGYNAYLWYVSKEDNEGVNESA